MYCKLLNTSNNWIDIKNAALTTVNKINGKQPDSIWKKRILMSEHSMIRKLRISSKWYDLKYWISVHIVRHWLGILHFVRSQRTDRTGIDRDTLFQNEYVEHEIDANAQAIINISKRRLCHMASLETREAWRAFLDSFKDKEPELYSCCVKECVYRNGLCPEYNSCGYNKTLQFEDELKQYLNGMENQINNKTNIFN